MISTYILVDLPYILYNNKRGEYSYSFEVKFIRLTVSINIISDNQMNLSLQLLYYYYSGLKDLISERRDPFKYIAWDLYSLGEISKRITSSA